MSAKTDTFPFNQKIAWQPNPQWIAESNLQSFMNAHNIASYDDLFRKSIEDIQWFWDATLADLNIEFYKPYKKIVDFENGAAFPKWCVDGKMNIIHNCLDKWQETPTRNRVALRWEGEEGEIRQYTYADLHREVNRCANGLRCLGLGKGDAVGLYMPMIPELAIAFLAIIKIGGIILPLFSGYGPTAVAPDSPMQMPKRW
ncbi:MAG: AMP-binding protein [Calditrichia bacterium]